MNFRFLFTLVISVLSITTSYQEVFAQNIPYSLENVDPSTLDVSNISDEQILKALEKMRAMGMSMAQVIELAKAKGATQAQIDQFKQRANQLEATSPQNKITDETAKQLINNTSTKDATGQPHTAKPVNKEESKNKKKIYGHTLFNKESLTFEPSVNIPVPEHYIVGIGDLISIAVWGASEANYSLKVLPSGAINIPNIGPVFVSGIELRKVKELIAKRLQNIYNRMGGIQPDTWARVDIGSIRSIKISVVGEANLPGTYTLPATASAFNALYLSGGPNEIGSFRSIKIIRNDKLFRTIDVYDFLVNSNTESNVQLRDQDVIYIPTYENRVEVSGEFKRTGVFELLKEETLSDLLKMTGGFTEKAYTGRLSLTRKTNIEKKLHDIEKGMFGSFILTNGDKVSASAVIDRFENRVSIFGAVFKPGKYELTEKMMLSELIKVAEGVKEDAFLNRGVISRKKNDLTLETMPFVVSDIINKKNDISLKKEDVVTIRSIFDLRENRVITVKGEVQKPGEFAFSDNMSLSDIIFLAKGFKENADISYIEISRRLSYNEAATQSDKISHIFTFPVSRDLKLTKEDSVFKLAPFDIVYIRRAPGYREQGEVKVTGEILYAGSYNISNKNETVSDIIMRAGGLSSEAYPKGATLTRVISHSKATMAMMKKLSKVEASFNIDTLAEKEKVIIAIQLDKILNAKKRDYDLLVMPGDHIHIPIALQTVKISGNVMSPIAMAFKTNKKLKHYIDRAGGFAPRSKKLKTFVRYPNGITVSTRNYLLFGKYPKIEPGCEIIVPKKEERQKMTPATWIAIGSGITTMAVSIATLVNLLNK